MNVKIRKLHADAVIPEYATDGSAGFDLVAIEDVIISPGETKLIRTGLAFEIPPGYEMQIRPRSGISLRTKLRIANAPGTIDSDFRGEVAVIVENTIDGYHAQDRYPMTIDGGLYETETTQSDGAYNIRKGDRIAQGVIVPIKRASFEVVTELSETRRGDGAYGSTGTSDNVAEGPIIRGSLAVDRGVCPFPYHCDRRFTCTKTSCHFDECRNGYAFRRS